MPGVAEAEPELRQKKLKKPAAASMGDLMPAVVDSEKKKKKKRKAEDENGSVEANGHAAEKPVKKKTVTEDEEPKQKKAKVADDVDSDSENPYALSNFRISDAVKKKLQEKGIRALFAIQAQTFDIVYNGDDLVGRARTGQGKTLAFVLPIVESLSKSMPSQRKTYGRAPSVIVLAPTRELAKQVHADFEFYGNALGLSTVCVYGGSQYGPQENALRRGVDIVVGTPGRIKDFLERGALSLKTLKFRVLDEADEMLNMGFVDDVERILGHVEDTSTVQTLLFSATMPHWVKEISKKFFKPDKKTVDLVGDQKMKASTTVRHLLLPCVYSARRQMVSDVIKVYGSGGRVIVFTETKNDASELTSALGANVARALHGDIPQAQRESCLFTNPEHYTSKVKHLPGGFGQPPHLYRVAVLQVTLAGFRTGKFNVLVATDVAARGLDINDVQLIIQSEPPRDVETYIHRSGRTGRAGHSGIAVMLYDRKKEYMIPQIEGKAGLKFERISPPQPETIAKESASVSSKGVSEVADSVVPLFREAAQELVDSSGLPAIDVLAKALAKISGYTSVKRRSLLTSHDDATTLIFQASRPIYSVGYIFNALRGFLDEEVISEVRRMNLTLDGNGAVFDVPTKHAEKFVTGDAGDDSQNFTISIADSLPELQAKPERDNSSRNGGFSGRGGRGGGGRGGSGRGRGSSSGRGRWSR